MTLVEKKDAIHALEVEFKIEVPSPDMDALASEIRTLCQKIYLEQLEAMNKIPTVSAVPMSAMSEARNTIYSWATDPPECRDASGAYYDALDLIDRTIMEYTN